jgi:DNA polymerase-3 subunit epsilon
MSRQLFLDTETTGLRADEGDRIIEIGCVELVDRRPTGRNFHVYLNPERESHPDALRVHGLSSDFLADKPKFAEVAADLLAYISGAELLIHNAPFDIGFLNAELRRLTLPALDTSPDLRVTDTLEMARRLYPGQSNKLDTLCKRLGVDNSLRTFHGALLDAQLLADVYIGMTRGQNSLLVDSVATGKTSTSVRQDLSDLQLVVLPASAEELHAHQTMLSDIGKKAPLVWQ